MPPQAEMAPPSRENRPSIVGPDKPQEPYPMLLEGQVTRGFGRGARFLGIPTANLPDSSLAPLNDLQMTGIYYGFARVHPSISTPLPSALPSPALSGTSTPTGTGSGSHRHKLLSAEAISALPAHTAPYPPDSVPLPEPPSAAGGGDSEPAPAPLPKPKRLAEEDSRVWPMVMSVGWNPYFKNEKITAEVHIIHPFAHDFYGHDMSVLVLGYIRPELDYVSREALIDDINTDVKVALNCLSRPAYATLATDPRLAPSAFSYA